MKIDIEESLREFIECIENLCDKIHKAIKEFFNLDKNSTDMEGDIELVSRNHMSSYMSNDNVSDKNVKVENDTINVESIPGSVDENESRSIFRNFFSHTSAHNIEEEEFEVV